MHSSGAHTSAPAHSVCRSAWEHHGWAVLAGTLCPSVGGSRGPTRVPRAEQQGTRTGWGGGVRLGSAPAPVLGKLGTQRKKSFARQVQQHRAKHGLLATHGLLPIMPAPIMSSSMTLQSCGAGGAGQEAQGVRALQEPRPDRDGHRTPGTPHPHPSLSRSRIPSCTPAYASRAASSSECCTPTDSLQASLVAFHFFGYLLAASRCLRR